MDVYWSGFNNLIPFILLEDPKSLLSEIQKTKTNYKLCPAVKDFAKNTFLITSPVDYEVSLDSQDRRLKSSYYDQSFFNDTVRLRNYDERLITLQFSYLFVADRSLQMEVTGAYYTDNEFTRSTTFIPGIYDIGNWARPIDCTFMLRKGYSSVKVENGDTFAYVRFLTDEPIRFIKFVRTRKLDDMIVSNVFLAKKFKTRQFKLSKWYDLYNQTKSKNLILKEIKENIIE